MTEGIKKRITVSVPVFNERASLDEVYSRTTEVLRGLVKYDYEIVFFDDGSTDGSREKIAELAAADAHVKAVFYSRNFGYSKNIFYCMQQAKGDCAILLHADLQNPPEVIPELVTAWENGSGAVIGIKNKSRENAFMYFLRGVFYWLMNAVFSMNLVPHATDFELLDRALLDVLKTSCFKAPFLRGIVAEYGANIEYVYYTQDRRRAGKSKFNLSKYYDFAIWGIVSSSKKLPRRMLCVGLVCMLLTILESLIHFLPQALSGAAVNAALGLYARACFFMLSLFLCFSAILGEFLIAAVSASDEKPLVTEEKRIGY
ncbi:MAG: glycosyltransferase family 2 protein [Clostridia bacterium]|nr:glycosyltransferase family 2 protein [Clostridia bacterium]